MRDILCHRSCTNTGVLDTFEGVRQLLRIDKGRNPRSQNVQQFTNIFVRMKLIPFHNIPQIQIADLRHKIVGLLLFGLHQRNSRKSAVNHIIIKGFILGAVICTEKLREGQGQHVNLIASAFKLGNNVAGQKFGIASGNKDVHIVLAKISVQHRLKATQLLNLVKQQIVHSFIRNTGINIVHKLSGVHFAIFFINLPQVFADQSEVISRVKCKFYDMPLIDTLSEQMIIKQCIQKIRLSASSHTGYHLDKTVLFSYDQFVQI